MTNEEYVAKFEQIRDEIASIEGLEADKTHLQDAYKVYVSANALSKSRAVLEAAIAEEGAQSMIPRDQCFSELAWTLYSEEQSAESVEKAAELLLKAIELNGQNVTAQMRLGTLVHLYAHSFLKDANIPEKSEQMKWLRALKLDTQNAELFYCIGVYTYLVKGDTVKAKSCAEKALVLKPNLVEALYLLCVITWNMGYQSKVVELVSDFE